MGTQTYSFYGSSGVIPGVPGQFSAGTWVTINTDTLQVVSQGFLPSIPAIVTSDVTETVLDYGETGVVPDVANQLIDAGHEEVIDATTDSVLSDHFLPSS